jgi:MFS family permease
MYFNIALTLRAVQSVGTSAYFTAAYAIMVEEWRGSKLAFALGIYEAFTGLGMIIGPLTGSLLFALGGFALPFYVVAAMLMFAAITNFIFLESDDRSAREGYIRQETVQQTNSFLERFRYR